MSSEVKRYTHAKSVIMLVVSPESYEHDETHGLYVTAEDYAAVIAERDAQVEQLCKDLHFANVRVKSMGETCDGLRAEVARLAKLYQGELDYSACLEAQKAEAVVLLRRWEGMVSSIIFLGEYEMPLKDETAAYLYAHDGEPRQSGETPTC